VKLWRWMIGLWALVSAGCFGTVSDPVRHYYTLHLEPLHQHPGAPHMPGLLRVRDLDSEAAYDRFQIVMRRSPFELSYRQRDVWAVKPGRMVSDLIARGIGDQNIFAGVTRELGERRPDYTLSGELRALEIYDSDDLWFAHLALFLQLSHSETGKILWTFTFDDRKRVPPQDFSHAVRSVSELLTDAVEKALDSMEHVRSPEDVSPMDLQEAPLTRPTAPSPPKLWVPPAPPDAEPDEPILVPERGPPN
jgi:ABC-type uncharacterized transport system auxiliary subunit